jgi:hypothetical protein
VEQLHIKKMKMKKNIAIISVVSSILGAVFKIIEINFLPNILFVISIISLLVFLNLYFKNIFFK